MFVTDRSERDWMQASLPNVMPVIQTAQYRKRNGYDAVHVSVKNLFSFDLIHHQKMWHFDNSDLPPFGRYAPSRSFHRSRSRTMLEVAQILYTNGLSVLLDDVELGSDIHYIPELDGNALQLFEADLIARSAYLFVRTQARDEIKPRPLPQEIWMAKQLLESFDTWFTSRGRAAQSWLTSDVGSRMG